MARKRGMTVFFMDGSRMHLEFPEQLQNQMMMAAHIDKALEKQHLVVEADGSLMVIPFDNVKYIEVHPCPEKLPDYVIHKAHLSA